MTIVKVKFPQRISITAIWVLALSFAVCGPTARGQYPNFYVAKDGNDTWLGTLPKPDAKGKNGPLATFDGARAAVQRDDKTGLSQVTVEFRSGTYYLTTTEQFTGPDSGTATTPIVYENYPNESVEISGGLEVKGWTNISGNVWQTKLPGAQYFEQLFYNGERRLRPRLGVSTKAECDDVTQDGAPKDCRVLGKYFRIKGPVIVPSTDPTYNSTNCPVAATGGYECFDRFEYYADEPISGTWMNLTPPMPPPSPTCDASTSTMPAPVGDIELMDFEKYTASKLRISCVDTTNHIVYLTGPTATPANGDIEAHGFIANHRYLIENVEDELKRPGQWFLDRSQSPMVLTYLAKDGENPNTDSVVIPQLSPLSPEVLLASNLQYVTFQGLTFEHDNYTLPYLGHPDLELPMDIPAAVSFQNSQHITFNADTVRHTSGAGLEFISCIAIVLVPRCVSGPPPPAITSNNTVENSAFYDLGESGIRVGLQTLTVNTDANVPQFTTVQNTVIEGYGRVFPAAFGIPQGLGHDNTYMNNDVYDGYHAAIAVCDCTTSIPAGSHGAYNNSYLYNHVYNLLQGIMNDAGSLYFATGITGFSATGNQMLNNKIHDVSDASALDGWPNETPCPNRLPCDGYGGHGIYLDTNTGSVQVMNNLVYRVSGYAVNIAIAPIASGDQNIIENNIFAFARLSMIGNGNPYLELKGVPPSPIQVFAASNNLFYFDRSTVSTTPPSPPFYVQGGCTYSGGPFTSAFTYPAYQLWANNLYWRTDTKFGGDPGDPYAFHAQLDQNTATFPCSDNISSWTFYTFAGWQGLPPPPSLIPGEDAGSVVQNPGFNNPAYPADDYSLPGGAPIPGFMVFYPNEAGRSDPVINPPAVGATFITKPFDPTSNPLDLSTNQF